MLEETLEGRDYLLDRGFSAADISMGYTLLLAKSHCQIALPSQVDKYFKCLATRPAFQFAVADARVFHP